jgi:hypothetical protein
MNDMQPKVVGTPSKYARENRTATTIASNPRIGHHRPSQEVHSKVDTEYKRGSRNATKMQSLADFAKLRSQQGSSTDNNESMICASPKCDTISSGQPRFL